MLKRVISAVIGTRHQREGRRIQPIVDAVNEHYARLRTVSEEELRGQTERFRGVVRDRTAALETKIADLKERKHTATDPAERDAIDVELSGTDGRSGAEKALRDAISETLDEILPEAFATVREAARRLVGSTAGVTRHEMPWDTVHYNVQRHGGRQLHLRRTPAIATSERNTLVPTPTPPPN